MSHEKEEVTEHAMEMEVDRLAAREVAVDATDPVAGVAEQVGRMNIHGSTTPLGHGLKLIIMDCQPPCASTTRETQVVFAVQYTDEWEEEMQPTEDLVCMCGDINVLAPCVQPGMYFCWIPPQPPGKVSLELSWDGAEPISQAVSFEFRQSKL